jgi:transposase InsO family protein
MPSERWHNVSLDFVFGIPLSSVFDSILVVKDCLTKCAHYIPCLTTIDAPATSELFFREIFCLHGLPKTIVSDRGPQFASKFWRRLFEVLGVDIRLSTAFHPETDGSTEVTNQVMEQYLRIFCNFKQNDWFHYLPLAELTYNNSVNSTTQLTPFYAESDIHPLFDPAIPPSTVPSTKNRAPNIQSIILTLQDNLTQAQRCYTCYANHSRLPVPASFQVGQLVYLDW